MLTWAIKGGSHSGRPGRYVIARSAYLGRAGVTTDHFVPLRRQGPLFSRLDLFLPIHPLEPIVDQLVGMSWLNGNSIVGAAGTRVKACGYWIWVSQQVRASAPCRASIGSMAFHGNGKSDSATWVIGN